MDLTDVFGINVFEQHSKWFYGQFAADFKARFSNDKGMTLVLLDPDEKCSAYLNWRNSLKHQILAIYLGDELAAMGTDGTYENVGGKLQYCLREDEDSVKAETHPERVRVGDFPWEGAGVHRGWWGGVSGLKKEEDWEMFKLNVDWIVDLIGRITAVAMKKADKLRKQDDCPPGTRYLIGITVTLEELEAAV